MSDAAAKGAAMKAAAALNRLITAAQRTVFFGGAGVSTESGVPDFRGAHGLYRTNLGAESILTPTFMHRQPDEFWAFYRRFFMMPDIQPNAAHRALAQLEAEGRVAAVVTQNVDGLHQLAGSRRVLELHGNGTRFFCESCGRTYDIDQISGMAAVPHCGCGGSIRPDIVLYNESLDSAVIEAVVEAISAADLLIIGGTSLTVYPAAGLIRYQRSGKLVVINRDPTGSDSAAHLVIREPIGALFEAVMQLRS